MSPAPDTTNAERTALPPLPAGAYRRFFENAVEGIFCMSLEGRLTAANPAMATICGFARPEDLLASEDASFGYLCVHPRDAHTLIRRLETEGRLVDYQFPIRRADGETLWVSQSVRAVRDPRGRPAGYEGTLADVTDRRSMEEQRRQTNAAVLEADRLKGEFLANLSHELRTPMNAIIAMTELSLEFDLEPEIRENLEIAKGAAFSLLDSINDVIDFSTVSSGRLELSATEFRLRKMLTAAVADLAVRADEKGLDVLLDIGEDVPDALVGDPDRIRQVLRQLLNNAVEFTGAGEVSVGVSVEERRGRDIDVRFEVRDTGTGVPRELQDVIFEAFRQADGSLTRRHEGLGIGLSLAARLVELQQGRITLSSTEAQGSTFSFSLPLEERPSVGPPPGFDRVSLFGSSVFVVEPSAPYRRFLYERCIRLRLCPALFESASAARSALEQLLHEKQPLPIVLLDGNLARDEGTSLLEWLHAQGHGTATTIVMASPRRQAEEAAHARALEAAAILHKPFCERDLRNAVATARERAAGVGEPHRRSLRVLVVDDSRVSRTVARRVLETAGHTVDVAANGREGVERHRAQNFDLIVMDLHMPLLGGLEATDEIRRPEQGTTRHVPIVAVTAHTLEMLRGRSLEAGMDAFLAKPFHARDLVQSVEETYLRFASPQPSVWTVSVAAAS